MFRPSPSSTRLSAALSGLPFALSAALAASPAGAVSVGADPIASEWAALLAGANPVSFDAAQAGTGAHATAVTAGLLTAAPRAPGEVVPGIPSGGALGIEDTGEAFLSPALAAAPLAGGVSGAALSTRDLAWPYGLALDFLVPAVAVDFSLAALNGAWSVAAFDAEGALLGETSIGPETERLTLSLSFDDLMTSGGIARLELDSLDGYDWIYLDALRLAEAEAALPEPAAPAFVDGDDGTHHEGRAIAGYGSAGDPLAASATSAAPIPLPAPLALLGAGLAWLAWLRGRR